MANDDSSAADDIVGGDAAVYGALCTLMERCGALSKPEGGGGGSGGAHSSDGTISLSDAIAATAAASGGAPQWAGDALTFHMLWGGREPVTVGAKGPISSSPPPSARPPPVRCFAIANPKAFAFTLQANLSAFVTVALREAVDASDEASAREAFGAGVSVVADAEEEAGGGRLKIVFPPRDVYVRMPSAPSQLSSPLNHEQLQQQHSSEVPAIEVTEGEGSGGAEADEASSSPLPADSDEMALACAPAAEAEAAEEVPRRRTSASVAGEMAAEEVTEQATASATVIAAEAAPLTPPPLALAREATASATESALISGRRAEEVSQADVDMDPIQLDVANADSYDADALGEGANAAADSEPPPPHSDAM